MEQPLSPEQENILQKDVKKDRSLLYMGAVLGAVILIMGYLTFFVNDVSNLFSANKTIVLPTNNKSELLNRNSSMDDAEIHSSLVKFIAAFYYDQQRGYFDPPSYFSNITDTYYNFHNLTHQRLREVHSKRLSTMLNLNQTWMASSLEYVRNGSQLVVTFWTQVSYYRPSGHRQESAEIKNEMIIDENGKISSLRDLEVKNLISYIVAVKSDTTTSRDHGDDDTHPETGKESFITPAESSENPENKLYDLGSVQTAPEFIGGQNALLKYLKRNLKYPSQAQENNIDGKVYVSFVVEKNGMLTDLKIIKGIGYGCDEEVIRVLKSSPPWKPGMNENKPVRTSYTLPVRFSTD
jgi:TonB family protein